MTPIKGFIRKNSRRIEAMMVLLFGIVSGFHVIRDPLIWLPLWGAILVIIASISAAIVIATIMGRRYRQREGGQGKMGLVKFDGRRFIIGFVIGGILTAFGACFVDLNARFFQIVSVLGTEFVLMVIIYLCLSQRRQSNQ